MKEKQTWYTVFNVDEIDSPALLFYPSRVKENIVTLKNMIDDPLRLRPHVKTHKTREAAMMLMNEGIKKFKCATLSEAEMLGMDKVPDVLLAYQPVGPKVKRWISLLQHYSGTHFSCLVDHPRAAAAIASAAAQAGLQIPVYIDLNVGMNRTGVAPGAKAIELYAFCSSLTGVHPVGLHFYDGHIREKDLAQRRIACTKILTEVERTRKGLLNAGYETLQLVAGGSPTFPIYAQVEGVECCPGTFIFWDQGYLETLPEQKFLPAAVIATRIISLPDEQKICLDLGYKSIASENHLIRRVHFLNAPDLKVVSQSEEHLVVEAPVAHSWQPGDVLYALPFHICPTVALYEKGFVVEQGMVVREWKILARNRKIHF